VSPDAWSAIDQVIRAELGSGVDELFATFERTPLAYLSSCPNAVLLKPHRLVAKKEPNPYHRT
jgi:hypothetical protein